MFIIEALWSEKQWPKVHLLARKGFFNLVLNYSLYLSWFAVEAAAPSTPPNAHEEHATWSQGTRSTLSSVPCWDALGHTGW